MRVTGHFTSDARSGTRSTAERLALIVAVLTVTSLVLASVATPVVAHASLSETDPGNGEQVDELPDEVTLTFAGDGVQVADVTVTGPDSEDVSGGAEIDPDDSQLVHVPLEGDANGADAADGMYTVDWEVLADDGHTTSGSFFFSVGDEPLDRDAVLEAYEDEDSPDDDASAVEAGAKGLLLVALIGLVGAPITAAVAVYPAVTRSRATPRARSVVDHRLLRLLGAAGALLVASVVVLGLTRASSLGSLSVETVVAFVETPLGQAWLVQLALAIILCVVLAAGLAGVLSRRSWLAGTVAGAVLVGGTVSWTSHSATAIDRLQGTAVDFAHIGGAGLWVGGLLVLALVVPPALRQIDADSAGDAGAGTGAGADRQADADTDLPSALAAATIRRYSLLALAGVTLAGATGLILAAWHVPSLSALSESVYGLSLSAKTLLVLLALGLGGLTRFVLLRQLESTVESTGGLTDRFLGGSERPVREDGGQVSGSPASTAFVRAVRFEVAVLVVVLLISGLLTSVPTAAVVGMDDDELETATIEREGPADLEMELLVAPAAVQGDDGDSEADEATASAQTLTVQPDDPLVFDVAFVSHDEDGSTAESDEATTVKSDGPVRLLADAVDADTTIDIALERTEDGSYATVQTLPDEGAWEVRITGAPNGEFVSEWYDVTVEPAVGEDGGGHAGHDHGEHGGDENEHDGTTVDDTNTTGADAFAIALQFGAVAIAIVGSVAVAIEATRLRE
ncbi:copper resistance protein CopC [Natrialba chahannaoensis JCM 10990]|uniref:Copper resistance protein CopC n=1 Tax=Natrialba chahannaoensis JCM 10990 TaxID=1227492 RepID=M0AE49_9EURY|nr:copper resistance protein CopC [Natrialba chahannaoensis]ELY96686.1 copper resistance protein CopC [Natrialba chahannaoensis JCM 10990]